MWNALVCVVNLWSSFQGKHHLNTTRPPRLPPTVPDCQILVDTVNLDTDAKRATQRDVAAAEELSRRVSWTDSPSEQGAHVAIWRCPLLLFFSTKCIVTVEVLPYILLCFFLFWCSARACAR